MFVNSFVTLPLSSLGQIYCVFQLFFRVNVRNWTLTEKPKLGWYGVP